MNNKPITTDNAATSGVTFFGLGIAPKILDILEKMKFKVPTPIQLKAIPLALEGKDIVGIAQTGTGKTHSFAIPMIQLLAQKKGVGLVLAPTRELAIQIDEAFQEFSRAFGMKTACLIGGAPMPPQVQALRRDPKVVIATPGRLIDHMSQWNFLPDSVVMLVLDEADRMLDMGFAPQIDKILRFLPRERQTMLFSATMPKEILNIASKQMKLPLSVEIAPSGTTAEKVTQELFIVKRESKTQLLKKLLAQYHGAVLLFSRTKHNAKKIVRSIRDMGYSASEIHSNRSLAQRRDALEGFKSGRYKVMVATDIASRGIDVTGIELVVNYDLPEDAENYVHRIGRTARAGHKGHAVSFATPDQGQDVRDIEKLIKATLPLSKVAELTLDKFGESADKGSAHNNSRRPGFKGQRNARPKKDFKYPKPKFYR
ncbi:MAG: DEAD/DEAH box helicase [Candidatus Omnitrophica bacterium]|jgi:ATP-dependent RNA helicase RhlE|nr:DEAD/DEAH box helicase [Candidatus Omnitrophota bacterium]MDD3274978.1 DEAD/DEAH box helicase [Candidatus Omnitrophota bacterium]MDD5077788.1 DEAD/DEAH box helicase [Candidatus Omnitrophota bacterium]MDD5725447.1 DEAD/DEAH box helicase [Candidatus Omnitrophota bacterium]